VEGLCGPLAFTAECDENTQKNPEKPHSGRQKQQFGKKVSDTNLDSNLDFIGDICYI